MIIPRPNIAEVLRALHGARLPAHDEKALQQALADRFDKAGIVYTREAKVEGGIIDFRCGAVGVEVKIKGGKRAIWRQVQRYAETPGMDAILVIAGMPLALPGKAGAVDVVVHEIGGAWL